MEGREVGACDGTRLGVAEGRVVGSIVGLGDGNSMLLGNLLGLNDGAPEGLEVVGANDGQPVGLRVGDRDGLSVNGSS